MTVMCLWGVRYMIIIKGRLRPSKDSTVVKVIDSVTCNLVGANREARTNVC